MRRKFKTSLAEDLIMAPWWVSLIVCAIGNTMIWVAIPYFLEANNTSGLASSMLTGGYAGAKPVLSLLFNLAMAIVFVFSLLYNFVFTKRG